jgi:hypothetical protein
MALFLDIYRENKLIRETKDIVGELYSMILINWHQGRVLAEFIKHADHTLQELRKSSPEEYKHERADWWRKEHVREIEASQKDRDGDLNNLKQAAEDVGHAVSIRYNIP